MLLGVETLRALTVRSARLKHSHAARECGWGMLRLLGKRALSLALLMQLPIHQGSDRVL